nr:DUF5625 family protein [Herbaspirillum sp. ASV7]
MIKKKLRKLMALIGLGFMAKMQTVHAADSPVTGVVHESRFHMPFPVQKGGEKIDVLVRVEKTNRAYGFYLIFVEDQSWSVKKKESLRRLYDGWGGVDMGSLSPYPIRIHLQIDPVDKSNTARIDVVVTEREPVFGRYVNNDKEIWRSQALYLGGLSEGVYRVRLENLAAVSQIDFPTLFGFEKDTRKY